MSKRLIIGLLLVLTLVVLGFGANTARNVARWQPFTTTPDERHQLLASGWRLVRPAGPGPHKAAVLMSGCDGVHDNMDLWADRLVAMGRAALIVDSHHPRGLDQNQAWRAICTGQVLTGAERAGDIAVALEALRQMPDIDAQDVILLGASHGGWSVMELLQLLGDDAPPPGLSAWPAPRDQLARQIGPVILLYPYCGLASGAGKAVWPEWVRGLLILAEKDSIVDTPKCLAMAEGLIAKGAKLEITVLPGADHGFDQSERSVLSPLKFDQRHTDAAMRAIDGFLRHFANPVPKV